MKQERLDKILSGSGRFTRSEAKALIQSGNVLVDGVPVRRAETKILRSSAVTVKGQAVETDEFVYYMMNKSSYTGYVKSYIIHISV